MLKKIIPLINCDVSKILIIKKSKLIMTIIINNQKRQAGG